MIIFRPIIVICFLLYFTCFGQERVNCWNDIDFKKTERILLNSKVKKIIPFYSYYAKYKKNFPKWNYKIFMKRHKTKPIFVLILNNNLKAVFKPKSKKRLINAVYSSVIAYNFSRMIDLKLVPPTVIRKIQGKVGSTQLFIDDTIMGIHDKQTIKKLNPTQKGNIYIFYFLSGISDANYLNILISKKCNKPVIVDNDSMLKIVITPYGQYPFILYLIKHKYLRTSPYLPLMDIKSFENAPFKKALNLFNPSWKILNKHFSELNKSQLKSLQKDFLERGKHQKSKHLAYFKYRGGYWVGSKEIFEVEGIYKNLLPLKNKEFFSEKTIQSLKNLGYNNLRNLFPRKSIYKIYDSKVYGILHRRDIILREYKKVSQKTRLKN